MIYKNKKINIFLVVVIIFVLLISLLVVIFGDTIKEVVNNKEIGREDSKTTPISKNDIKENIEELKELNKDVIAQAKKIKAGSMRRISEEDHYLGDINAPVEFIVYCDFRNSLCADFLDTIEMVKKEFGDKVVIAFRHFFVASNSSSRGLALASECAADQGKFWEMHYQLFENISSVISDSHYTGLAAKIPFKKVYFDKCMKEDAFGAKIEAQIKEGEDFGILGTPSSFINGEKIPGSYSFEDFTDSSGRSRLGVKSIIEKYLDTE